VSGPYCKFCDHRCFVYRVLNTGEGTLLATCPKGMLHDAGVTGQDHTTAHNPASPDDCTCAACRVRRERAT
jgi:hypothetical protein